MRQSILIPRLKEAVAPFKADANVILFGSQARGDAKENSDVDLLILFNKENVSFADERRISAPLYDIELETGVLINPIIIPARQWGQRVTPFYENVTREGIEL